MFRIAFATAVVTLICLSSTETQAGRRYYQQSCSCNRQVITTTAPVPEQVSPPAAPNRGQTVQNLSVEPEASTGRTQSSGIQSYNPAPANLMLPNVRSYNSSHHDSRVGEIQNRRLHPKGFFSFRR